MRQLYAEMGGVEEWVVEAYAQALDRGEIARPSSAHGVTALQYAQGMWRDGVLRKWLYEDPALDP